MPRYDDELVFLIEIVSLAMIKFPTGSIQSHKAVEPRCVGRINCIIYNMKIIFLVR